LSTEQAEKLKALAAKETGSLGINILLSLGVIAIAGGFLALEPSVATALVIGVALVASGLALKQYRQVQWGLLGTANIMIGALTVSGGLIVLWEGSVGAFALVALILLALGVFARSGLLIAVSPLALASLLGSSTGYWHASYMLIIREATITIAVFALLAWGTFVLSKRLPATYERLALIYSRMSLVLVNFGFWVGSLWGDYPGESWVHSEIYRDPALFWRQLQQLEGWRESAVFISDIMFAVLWALALIAVGAWGVKRNRRFVVNTAAVFGSILLYTQWFERLGATPVTVIFGGIVAVGIALGLRKYNRLVTPMPQAPSN
jgi:hypothetical protein